MKIIKTQKQKDRDAMKAKGFKRWDIWIRPEWKDTIVKYLWWKFKHNVREYNWRIEK